MCFILYVEQSKVMGINLNTYEELKPTTFKTRILAILKINQNSFYLLDQDNVIHKVDINDKLESSSVELLKLDDRHTSIRSLHLNNNTLYIVDDKSISKYELESNDMQTQTTLRELVN